MKLGKTINRRGVVLLETIWLAVIFVGLSAGAHIALVKYWNHRLEQLQRERLPYDGFRKSKN